MSGHSKIIMFNSIVVGVVLIGSNFFLVPRFGIVGAACATSFCVAANSLLCVMEAKRVSGIIPYSLEHMKPLTAAALAIAGGFLFKSIFAEGSVLLLVPVVAVVFVGALLAMGLHDGDRRAFASMFPGAEPMMRAWTGRSGGGR
jgi:O-antigen/teichoic acid export membrane protein